MRALAEKASLGAETGSRRVFEIASTGVDEFLQGFGSDPFGGSSYVGLRVPTLATPSLPNGGGRYLFNLASFSIATGVKARIVGYRQLLTLGAVVTAAGSETPARFVEQEVTTPTFRLPDGNVSWHIHRLGPPNSQGFPTGDPANLTDIRSLKKNFSINPSLLYQSYTIPAGNAFYPDLTAYVPPNGGKPWGTALRAGNQYTFHELKTQWRTHGAWAALDMELEGPDTVCFFASVKQSAGASEAGVLSAIPNGMPEEQFVSAFAASVTGAIYWRVAGALMVEIRP
jgi:hypothetical protein